MNQIIEGYVFKCKVCEEGHLIVKTKPYDGIRIPCAWNNSKVIQYKEEDFKLYQGTIGLFPNLVEERK